MKDIIIFDVETKNTFADVGGQENIGDLNISVACAYSLNRNEEFTFWEENLRELGDLMKNAGLVVGFSINRFDLPVIAKYVDFNVRALKRIDLLEEIEASFGRRISLDLLANANLGVGKTQESGLQAIRLWNEGKREELAEYCMQDVRLTRDLFLRARDEGHLMVPDRSTGGLTRVVLPLRDQVSEIVSEETLF